MCHICGLTTNKLNGLMSRHWKSHCNETYTKEQYKIDVLNHNGRPQVICEVCGKPTKIAKGEANYPKYHKACYQKIKVGEKNPNYRGGKIKTFCPNCGKELNNWESRVKKRKQNFCSASCSTKFYSTQKKHIDNHHPLPNGKTLCSYLIEKGIHSKNTIISIYKKDGPEEALKFIDNYTFKVHPTLPGGERLIDVCKEKKIPYSSVLKIYKDFGSQKALKHIKSYKPQIIRKLPNGENFNSYCIDNKANKKIAAKIYDNIGPEAALIYIDEYQPKSTDIENIFEGLFKIKKYDKQIILNDKKYRPDFKLSETVYVDIDGLYWHSDKVMEDNFYHFHKREKYEQKKMRIFQIRADEITNKMGIVKSIINIELKNEITKIFARKTSIKLISNQEASKFFDKNHLMGSGVSAKAIGLYYNNELIMCLSYKKYKKGIDISRVCSKLNTLVVGGLGKLIKYIEKEEKPKFIQSFVDLRYGTGKSLEKLGFIRVGATLGWKWTDGTNTFNRLKCRANMDERRLSESQYAEELGWHKIYDAGQAKYIKTL